MSTNNSNIQIKDMQDAISKVVTISPEFLSHKISATQMAHTMIQAVEEYEKKAKQDGSLYPQSSEAEELLAILAELNGCGSGFLADRCDAACVARTITYVANKYPNK
ncbi:MAG: hypothetical protein M9897_02270 [Brumimicrobium sp.]|nr:hypothetical protein [Brumimicrobium sp.]